MKKQFEGSARKQLHSQWRNNKKKNPENFGPIPRGGAPALALKTLEKTVEKPCFQFSLLFLLFPLSDFIEASRTLKSSEKANDEVVHLTDRELGPSKMAPQEL